MSNLSPSYSSLSPNIIDKIMSYIPTNQPNKIVSIEIKKCAREILCFAMVDKHTNGIFHYKISDLKTLHHLVKKYKKYNGEYDKSWKKSNANPHLIDVLFTGWPEQVYGKHSLSTFTQETEKDIKELVRLTPQCLESHVGQVRLFGNITPLFVACLNVQIPVHIVKFLLESGANVNASIDGINTPLIKAIYWSNVLNSEPREKAIQAIFEDYLWKKSRLLLLSLKDKKSLLCDFPIELIYKILEATLIYLIKKPSGLWKRGELLYY